MPLKNSGQAKSTAKASRASKNILIGNELEQLNSKIIHRKQQAVLISPRILREMGCGQVDLCSYHNKRLTIYEVKSSPLSLNSKQRLRLNRSLEFLTRVFNVEGQIKLVKYLPKD